MAVLEQQETFSDINESSLSDLTTNPLLAGEVPGDEPDSEERTYHFVAGQEETADPNSWAGNEEVQYLTQDELKQAFEEDKTLKATFESFDNYLGYMDDRQDLIDSGDYDPNWWDNDEEIPMYQDPVFVLEDGSRVPASEYNPSMGNAVSMEGSVPGATGGAANVGADQLSKQFNNQSALLEESFNKYATGTKSPSGSAFQHTAKDNNMYNWNGTSWVKTKSRDKTNYAGIIIQTAVKAGFAIVAGPQIGAAMGLSGAAAAAAGAAVTNIATQAIITGSVDPKEALVSAALAYGGVKLGEAMAAATESGGALADINNSVNSFVETVSGGSTIAEAAIKAGGISALTQIVVSGEVDLKQAALAALLAGGTQAFTEFKASFEEFDFASGEDWDTTFEELDAELEAEGLIEITPTGEYKEVPDAIQDVLDRQGKDYGGFEEPPQSLEYDDGVPPYDPNLVGPPRGDDLVYRDSGAYFDSEGNQVDNVNYSLEKDSYVDSLTGETVTLQTDDGVYDTEGNLYAYQEDGQWFRGDGSIIDDPVAVDELVNISQESGVAGEIENLKAPEGLMDGSTEFVDAESGSVYEAEGNQVFEDITGTPKDLGPAQYSGTIKSMDGDYDVYYNPETNKTYLVNRSDPTQVQAITQEELQQIESQSQTEQVVEGATPDVETG